MTLLLPVPGISPLRRLLRPLARGVAAAMGRSPDPATAWHSPGGSRSVAAAGEGRPAGIDELYRVRRLGLVRMAVLMVDDLATAEDIVQEAFAKLWRRHGAELRGVDDPGAYLTTAVLNGARSALRRRRSARDYVLPRAGVTPAAEDLVLLGEGDREVLAALGRLTVRQRQVVVLRYWSELSEREIADVLRVSSGTVKSTASRALTILREALGAGRR